ncbi:hypothetical protein [Lysinibacillus xylanilyticus]|uniref:hypothetical protein n=1 Tax=Lysinibacillus xylanilyticus TaxID=582475 RepID=UPI003D078ECC
MSNVIDIRKTQLLNLMNSHYKNEYLRIFGNDFSLGRFVPYCHAYAKHLLIHSHFNIYEIFIDAFNKIIREDQTFKYLESVQKEFFFINRNYQKLFIVDERIPIEKDQFKYEKDLENVLYQEFNDYFGNEISVKKQEYLGYGKSDISIDNKIAIELKINKAKRKDVYQTFEYSFAKGIKTLCLIAKEFDDEVLKIANKLNVDCYSYSFIREEVDETSYPIGIWLDKKTNTTPNLFDEYLLDISSSILFSFYDPKFCFLTAFETTNETLIEVYNQTEKLNKELEEILLKRLSAIGFDVSKGLEYAIQIYKDTISNQETVNQ